MIDEIKKNLPKDEKILWEQVKFRNVFRRMVLGPFFIILIVIVINLFFWVVSVGTGNPSGFIYFVILFDGLIGGIFFGAIVFSYRRTKEFGYHLEDLIHYERITIITNRRFIQRDQKYWAKLNTPQTIAELGGKVRDIMYLNLDLVERVIVYQFKVNTTIQLWLYRNMVPSGPNMVEFSLKNEELSEFWNIFKNLIALEIDVVDSTDTIHFFYRVGVSAAKEVVLTKNLHEKALFCPHCGEKIDEGRVHCNFCGKKLD